MMLFLAACGTKNEYVLIQSQPTGALLVDSEDRFTGQVTPAYLPLDLNLESHLVRVSKPGWREVPVVFNRKTTTELMGAQKAVVSLLCAPCCCGLPLLSFLDPVDITTRFVPDRVNLNLERTGGGVHVTAFPPHVEILVDGRSRGQLMSRSEVFVPLDPGQHDLLFRAPGFKDLSAADLRIDMVTPVRLNLTLEPISGSLYLQRLYGLPLTRLAVLDAGGTRLWEESPAEDSVLIHRLPPGDHLLRVEATLLDGTRLKHEQPLRIHEAEVSTVVLGNLPGWSDLKPALGVTLNEVGSIKTPTMDLGFVTYPEISSILVGSAAEKAGLVRGDVLLTLNGHDMGLRATDQDADSRLGAMERLRKILDQLAIGDSVLIEIERAGERLPLKVETLGCRLDKKTP